MVKLAGSPRVREFERRLGENGGRSAEVAKRSNVFYPVSSNVWEDAVTRWAFGIDPRLHSRDVTEREDRMGKSGKGQEGKRDKARGFAIGRRRGDNVG